MKWNASRQNKEGCGSVHSLAVLNGPGSLSSAQNKTTKCDLSNPLRKLGQDLEKAEFVVSDAAEMDDPM